MGKKKKRAFPEEAQAEKPAGRKKQAALQKMERPDWPLTVLAATVLALTAYLTLTSGWASRLYCATQAVHATLSSGAGGAPFWACRLYRTPVTAQSH